MASVLVTETKAITSAKEDMFWCNLFVCLFAKQFEKLLLDFDEIFRSDQNKSLMLL